MLVHAKAAAFIDRDGTICFDKHYLADPDGLEIIPTVVDGIRRLNEAGLMVIIVTNQSGIARGRFDAKRLDDIHVRLRQMLSKDGAMIDDIFFCPHMPDAGCRCRKPAPGMLLDAAEKHGIDLRRSYVIGDRMMDVELARGVGSKAVLVTEPGNQYDVESEKRQSRDAPDFHARDFHDAVEWVICHMTEID